MSRSLAFTRPALSLCLSVSFSQKPVPTFARHALSIVASPILDNNNLIWLCYVYVAIKASQRPALAQPQGREMGQLGTALRPPA